MELADKIKYGKLLDLYGGLLTEKQKYALEGYLLYDLSLTEMAEVQGLSRQAMFDSIQILIINIGSIITGVISSLVPIFKISRKKPVELIRTL